MKVHRLGKSDGRGKPYYPYFFNPGDSDVLAVLPLVYKNQMSSMKGTDWWKIFNVSLTILLTIGVRGLMPINWKSRKSISSESISTDQKPLENMPDFCYLYCWINVALFWYLYYWYLTSVCLQGRKSLRTQRLTQKFYPGVLLTWHYQHLQMTVCIAPSGL